MNNNIKALTYDLSIPKHLISKGMGRIQKHRFFGALSALRLTQKSWPTRPHPEWIMIRTLGCGICGSDLNFLQGKESFSMEPYSSFPIVLGHEAIGVISENQSHDWPVGTRVAIEPVLPCRVRNIENECLFCRDGDYALCSNFLANGLAAGPINGFNASVGGGFSEVMVAHPSQLFKIPDTISNADAMMIDSLASAMQPVATHLPKDEHTVIVYGCGIIGLNVINCIRALGSNAKILAVSRHDHQSALALLLGANQMISRDFFGSIADKTGAKLLRPTLGKPVLEGGVDMVFDCVGSGESLDQSLRVLKARGKLVLVATAGEIRKVDISRVWFKELIVTGSAMYSHVVVNGKKVRTYQLVIDLLEEGRLKTNGLLTHTFSLKEYNHAFNVALQKARYRSIKVGFTFTGGEM